MITDVHAHYFPRLYIELLARITERTGQQFGGAVRTDEPADIVQRLQRMDDAGVQRQVLSCVGVVPYAEHEADAVEAARACNDRFNDLVQRYPGRFSAFVSLPLPHIEASLRELQRGFDQLGMAGVTMSCSVFNRSVAEAEFEPLYEELNRRAAVLFFHPCQNGICSPFINDYRFHRAAFRRDHPDVAPASGQPGTVTASEPSGAAECDGAEALLRHGGTRLAGGIALRLASLWRRPSGHRPRLSRFVAI